MNAIYFLICFGASVIGAISGIGGGVIIKPVLDLFGTMEVATISFLSGSTVLAMTSMTLFLNRNSEVKVDKTMGMPLALGSVLGGLLGKQIFDYIEIATGQQALLGMLQSYILALTTIGVLVFTLKKDKINPIEIKRKGLAFLIGIGLGGISSFLGIGGGPINLAILYMFFGMNTKTAALNSINIIFFSQLASLLESSILNNIPAVEISLLAFVIAGGLLGGVTGAKISKRLSVKQVDKIYITLVVIIIFLSIYNGINYMINI